MQDGYEQFRKWIKSYNEDLYKELNNIRDQFKHPGGKGDLAVQTFLEFLKLKIIPRHLNVGHGEAIDTQWNRSKQLDIVIVNQFHPMTYATEHSLFFIEGVNAAGEVKMLISKTQDIIEVIEESVVFKSLQANSPNGSIVFSNSEDEKRFLNRRPFFLIIFDSKLTIEKIADTILTYQKAHCLKDEQFLDAVFVLNRGSIINLGNGTGGFQFRNSEGIPQAGWLLRKNEESLFDFSGWLSVVMPNFIFMPPIFPLYALKPYQ